MKIAILGVGRMGSLLAEKLSGPGREVWLVDKDPLRAHQVAQKVGAKVLDPDLVPGLDVVILALPAAAVIPTVTRIRPSLSEGSLLINIATALSTDKVCRELNGTGIRVAGLKIIGNAREIARGEIPLLVANTEDGAALCLLSQLFGTLGPVIRGDEAVVEKLNTIATRAGIRAAMDIEKEMTALGVGQEYLKPAIANVAAGTMKAFGQGDIGEFARQFMVEEEKG